MKKKQTQHCRIRIRFEKNDSLRFLGHRDLIRALERIFRRTGLELVMSEGFHPRPRMRFSDPLAVGQIGLNEVMDLTVGAIDDPIQLQEALNRHSIPGLKFKQIDILDEIEYSIIDTEGSTHLLMGGPGTGKTSILVNLFHNLASLKAV